MLLMLLVLVHRNYRTLTALLRQRQRSTASKLLSAFLQLPFVHYMLT